MVVKIDLLAMRAKVLNELSTGYISLKLFDVLLDYRRFMSDRKVESVVSQSKLKNFEFVRHSYRLGKGSIDHLNQSVVTD